MNNDFKVAPSLQAYLQEHFFCVGLDNQPHWGLTGFLHWASERGEINPERLAQRLVHALEEQEVQKANGRLDIGQKLERNFDESILDALFVTDFYSTQFGRTKRAELVYYGKNNELPELIEEALVGVKDSIEGIIADYGINKIGFITPTRKRNLQLMDKLQETLGFDPRLHFYKYGEIKKEQKSLVTVRERMLNARTIIVSTNEVLGEGDNILLIDDIVGSGSTLHEMARKIRKNNAKIRVYGYGLVGNPDESFEVVKV